MNGDLRSSARRARGCLLGQAVGDALGTTVEFQTAEAIALRWPGGVREIVGGGPFHLLPGQITDDTELALCLARSLVARGTWDADDVAAAYVGWFASGPVDFGGTTRQALGGAVTPGPGLAARLTARASTDSQANGALMRISPLGIVGSRLDEATLLAFATGDARLTHPHGVCQAANAIFTWTIARAIRSGDAGPALFEAALTFARGLPLTAPIVPTLEAAATALPEDFSHQLGWVRLALQAAFYFLKHARSFEEALCEVTSRGGDTDTNAAITGALLGAALGEDAIPQRWVTPVLACRPARPQQFHCHDLRELAVRLAEG